MKTIKQWLEELPEPHRTQALNNLKSSRGETEAPNLSNALIFGFSFNETPEGWDYWWKLYDNIVAQRINKS